MGTVDFAAKAGFGGDIGKIDRDPDRKSAAVVHPAMPSAMQVVMV